MPVPVAAVPVPANDVTPPTTVDEVKTAAVDSAAPPAALQPTPTQTNDITGTLGVVLLALLALAILAAGLLFFRRRTPAAMAVEEETLAPRVAETPVVAESPVAETVPVAATTAPMAMPTMLRRRELNSVAGALPSNGASVDLPATAPEGYEDRAALLDRMIEAKPDKANPFTDRRARMHRARLILQSLGRTFDREPRIDLSQYPNNWPELQRQYHKAA